MDDLWNEQGNNLRTMFEFTGETKRFSVNGRMFDKNDFIASYPFVNYEFGLFQDTLRGMSRFRHVRRTPLLRGRTFHAVHRQQRPARQQG